MEQPEPIREKLIETIRELGDGMQAKIYLARD